MGAAIAVAAIACAIDIPDVMPDLDGGGSDGGADGTTGDAVSDMNVVDAPPADVISPPICDGGCGATLPAGFGLVLYAPNRNTPCQPGEVTADLLADPAVTNTACTCGCTPTANGDCSRGQLGWWVDPNGNDAGVCSQPSLLNLNPNGPGCQVLNNVVGFSSFHLLDAAAPVDAGGCKVNPVPGMNQVTSTNVRVCVPTSCSDAICTPPVGERLCAISSGDVACPAGFSDRHIVAASASVTCGCQGTCTPSTACTGVITFYKDNACLMVDFSLSSDAGCQPTPTLSPASYKYAGTPNTTCGTSAVPSSSLVPTGTQTLCCKP